MRRLWTIALLPLLAVAGACSTPNDVTVEGPVDLGVSVERATVGEAVAASSEVANRVLDAVKAAGVEERDVQTRSYTVNQEFRFEEDQPPIPDGYRVSNSVALRIRDLPSAGA